MGFSLTCALFVFLNALLVWGMIEVMEMNDFGKFWYSAVAFLNNQDMYGKSPATLIQVNHLYSQQFWNLNPPHFHIFLLPLALLPPLLSLTLWGMASLVALVVTLDRIGNEIVMEYSAWRNRIAFLGLLAFSGTGATMITGQLSLIIFLPVTLAWLSIRSGRWDRGAVILGLTASIKPFLLIFLPYFLLKKRFKAALLATWCSAIPFAIGLLIFGTNNYRSWLDHLRSVDWAWASMNASIFGMLTRVLSENPTFAVLADIPILAILIWSSFAVIAGGITLLFIHHDRSPLHVDRAFFLLLLLAILCSPLGWIYYLFLPLGPATSIMSSWWTKEGRAHSSSISSLVRLRNTLFWIGLPGYFIPIPLTLWFQPNSWLTLSLGSSYCWSTVLFWIALLVDCRVANPHEKHFIGIRVRKQNATESWSITDTGLNSFAPLMAAKNQSTVPHAISTTGPI